MKKNMPTSGIFKICKKLIACSLIWLLSIAKLQIAYAAGSFEGESFNPGEMINHHIKDSHGWEIAHGLVIPLPIILYSKADGLVIFSSDHFFNGAHEEVDYEARYEMPSLANVNYENIAKESEYGRQVTTIV